MLINPTGDTGELIQAEQTRLKDLPVADCTP